MQRLSLKNTDDLTLMEAFNDFKDKCQIKNLSKETIKLYENQFLTFYRFVDDTSLLISEVTSKTVDNFILDLRSDNHNCNEITVNSYLRGIRAFLYYCMDMNYLPQFKIHIPKVDKKLKETYTDTELKVLLKKPDLKTCSFSEYKIWVFSNYLLATGNRISTALNVKIEDIDFTNGLIQLNHTKNRTSQLIPLSQTLATILKEYLKYRKGTPKDYVFCNTYGNKGDIRTYQDMLAAYNRRKGIEKTSAHLYRHTFAKKWILNGGDIFRLQKILGHSDLAVVKEYVQMFGSDLSIDFDKFNPLDRTITQTANKKLKMVL
ncbi:MAG: tyrosine-type recombinase/integrase [Lachnospiraceae bacterium]|nr:tyrosine-type recombinase/integrase [Lachnospiraceae bacterium]